jgi:hypothetical protein
MSNRRYRDCRPFVGRLFGDSLLQAVADAESIDALCEMTGVKRCELYRWIREAKR